jgi:hypothetical protein
LLGVVADVGKYTAFNGRGVPWGSGIGGCGILVSGYVQAVHSTQYTAPPACLSVGGKKTLWGQGDLGGLMGGPFSLIFILTWVFLSS